MQGFATLVHTTTDGCFKCRHDTSARRLFRQSVDEARTATDGIVTAGGVKTLLVWAHKEWTIGNLALVRFPVGVDEDHAS